jgi:hypothetical protein
VLFAALLGSIALSGAAAQETAASDVPDASAKAAEPPAVPAYLPLNARKRWHNYWHDTIFGPRPALSILGAAMVEHIGRQPVEWRLGAQGYARRVEDRFYSAMIGGTVHSSLAALLHQDTRYLATQDPSRTHRIAHALARTFVTNNDLGHQVFDVSGLAGIYAGAMLPMYWHPRHYSPWDQGVRAGNFGVIFHAGSNLLQEFQPDLKRLFSRQHSPSGAPAPARGSYSPANIASESASADVP